MPSRNRIGSVVFVIFVLVVLAVAAPFLAKVHTDPATWLTEALSASQPGTPNKELKQRVWVNTRSGLYYCRQSKFYGRIHPGRATRQGLALQKGYRPAEGQMCP